MLTKYRVKLIIKKNKFLLLKVLFLLSFSNVFIIQSVSSLALAQSLHCSEVFSNENQNSSFFSEEVIENKKNILIGEKFSLNQSFRQFLEEAPEENEISLNFKERWLLTKILSGLTGRSFSYGIRQGLGTFLPNVALTGNEMKDLSEEPINRFEMNILLFFSSLVERKILRPYLSKKINQSATFPKIGAFFEKKTKEERELILELMTTNIESAVRSRGLVKSAKDFSYNEWFDISKSLNKISQENQKISYQVYGKGKVEEVKILVDGKESFNKRQDLLRQARKSIDILVWAIYDDKTGEWLLNEARNKIKEGLPVRIIVDGQVAHRETYHHRLDDLEKAGAQVIRWVDVEHGFIGQHRKMIIIDEKHLVSGGMNFGDEYSHMNPAISYWRDTDIYMAGPFVKNVAQKLFDEIWDKAVKDQHLFLKLSPRRFFLNKEVSDAFEKPERFHEKSEEQSDQPAHEEFSEVELINHSPVSDSQVQAQFQNQVLGTSHIFRAIMSELQSVKKTIDIENAYVIAIPSFIQAVKQAVDRGVRVRIFTNSSQSVDEKPIGEAMMITAKKLLDVGAEIYLRKGSTLHSKFIVVDGLRSYVMSYNLHPRSERIEGEIAIRIESQQIGSELTRIFEEDIYNSKSAFRVMDGESLKIPMTLQLWLLLRLLYDDL